jgi:phytoene/squalene synthetase
MPDSSGPQADFNSLAADTVRDYDRDLYLCALLAPPALQPALMALYGFNVEITRARLAVSEAMIGHMRLKWWYDALDGIFADKPPHHPVAQALAAVVPLGLEREPLAAAIEMLADDFNADAISSLAQIEDRAAAIVTPIFSQALNLSDARGPKAEAAADHAGKAWGLVMELRRKTVHPADIRSVHDAARAHVVAIQGATGPAVTALLPMVLADIYLKRIAKAGYDLSHPLVHRNDPGSLAVPKLWWAVKRGRL